MASATEIAGEVRSAGEVQFLGAFTNKLDSKGRLSVPADFRKMLLAANPEFDGFICARSLTRPVLECGGPALLDHFMRQVSSIDEFDEDRELLEEAFLASSQRLFFDETGRVSMPAEMREHCGLTTHATLVGRRGIFQIWHPDTYQQRMDKLGAVIARHGETMRARTLPSMDRASKEKGGRSDR